MTCKYDSGRGATFDLSGLATLTQTSAAEVSDRIQTSQMDYLYTFGICKSVEAPANCIKPDGQSQVQYTSAPGWQTKKSEKPGGAKLPHCKYLGNPEMEANNKWSLLDPACSSSDPKERENCDPGQGVQLQYLNGQHCTNGDKRKLILNFKCSKSHIEKFERQVIDEDSHCAYAITIDSEYACPVECGFGSSGSMCNNHGVCRYDTDAKRARCFCNQGYTGAGCDQQGEEEAPSYGPVLGLLVFVTIAVVALIAGIVFLWKYLHNRTLPVSGEAYGRLQNDFGNNMMSESNASSGAPSRLGIGAAGL